MDTVSLIRQAIKEDLGSGDHTSLATIPPRAKGRAVLVAKEDGIVAGIDVAETVYKLISPKTVFVPFKKDGDPIVEGDRVFEVSGSSRHILAAERLSLNYIQHMSGIATHTRQLVEKIKSIGSSTVLLDTRKTTPNNRIFEKTAVRIGGGSNHRFGLFDMILIKDNHIDFAGGATEALKKTSAYLANYPAKKNLSLRVEIEVRTMEELQEVLKWGEGNPNGLHRIMLDNFTPSKLKEALAVIAHRYETEASGGITEKNILKYAETNVDFISVGALTHHIKSLDLSLKSVSALTHQLDLSLK
ncbi:MAG: carboxylating nicotinate-nucleotide diphosphorylase [Bacteroidales bacterium]|nr:carboxylating nicotinate-nucleotide diphosphorylase [Bacteroidales bacterium]